MKNYEIIEVNVIIIENDMIRTSNLDENGNETERLPFGGTPQVPFG